MVVGARDGAVYAFHLSNGSPVPGWPAHTGAPVDSTPSVADVDGSGWPEIFVGSGNSSTPDAGGYYSFTHTGQERWYQPAPDALASTHAVQASLAIGDVTGAGTPDVTAGAVGQEMYSFNAVSGGLNAGWPFFTADTVFSSPALADLYGNAQTEIVEGGDSTQGIAYGTTYLNGGHLRVINGQGQLLCSFNTNQVVTSSPAVGDIDGDGRPEIVFGTGSYYQGASDSTELFALGPNCHERWAANLGGYTTSSPALADVQGNGRLDVVEGIDGAPGNPSQGAVWVLNGSGQPLPGWPRSTGSAGPVIGGVTTADLTGLGYQDILVPTPGGVLIYDGRTAQLVATLGAGQIGVQSSPLVTIGSHGRIGVTIAGYNANNAAVVAHYVLAGSSGRSLGAGSWPMFHHDPRLTGNVLPPPLAYKHLNAPIVGIAATPNGGGYWEVASDGGLFAFGDAQFYGSMGGKHLNKPIVGIAATPNGGGYWEVASDGGLFAFGDAQFYGSMGGKHLNKPIVGIATTPNGGGYWEVASDGGLFAFGDAQFYGSVPQTLARINDSGTTGCRCAGTGTGRLGATQAPRHRSSPELRDNLMP